MLQGPIDSSSCYGEQKKKSLCQHMKVAGENVTVPHVDKAFFWQPQITQMAAVSF